MNIMNSAEDMKILWITGNPGRFLEDSGQEERIDGSWIASLQKAMQAQKNIELALAFVYPDNRKKVFLNGTTYYFLEKAKFPIRLFGRGQEDNFTRQIKRVIDDFCPDLIHIFGTETVTGLTVRVTDKPIIAHIQGWMHACRDAWYPPYYPLERERLKALIMPRKLLGLLYLHNAVRWEKETCNSVKFFFGRTKWDKKVLQQLAPNAHYFYCSELLRRPFYDCEKWSYVSKRPLTIVSIINNAPYKGADVILRTAALVSKHTNLRWIVCGVSNIKWAEQLTGIGAARVGVECVGRVSCKNLITYLQQCTCYVHLSYIENSPNSVCEAQLMGIPVIAAAVGGVPTLVKNGKTGILVPANDAYSTCANICRLKEDGELATLLGRQAAIEAIRRHDEQTIVADVLAAYKNMIQ